MMAAEIGYILLTAALGAGLWAWSRRRSVAASLGGLVGWLAVCAVLAVLIAEPIGSRFGQMRLLAWACLAELPVLLVAMGAARLGRQRFWGGMAIAAGLAVAAAAVNAVFIEPRALEINHHRVVSDRVEAPLRIALVADIQTDEVGAYERRALELVREGDPDLVLFAGDYVQVEEEPAKSEQRARFKALLESVGLAPRLGAFAVRGDAEREGWEAMFEGGPITPVETTESFVLGEGEVRVTALSRGDSFDASLRVSAERTRQRQLHIVLGHGPDFSLGEVDADLLLAGHTHGGQVQLPLLGPIITLSKVPRDWAEGVTALAGERTLVVSRGIGMERGFSPRVRFLCRPEVVFVDVVPRVRSRAPEPGVDDHGGPRESAAGEAVPHDPPSG